MIDVERARAACWLPLRSFFVLAYAEMRDAVCLGARLGLKIVACWSEYAQLGNAAHPRCVLTSRGSSWSVAEEQVQQCGQSAVAARQMHR